MEEKSMAKKGIRILAAIFCFILLIYLYQTSWKRTTITKIENEQNGYSVVFKEIGTPFLFGESDVVVKVKNDKGRTIARIRENIGNDGKPIGEWNISVVWKATEVCITLCGEEQPDESYVVGY